MPEIKHTVASLRIMGSKLQPSEISRMLRCEPSSTQMMGEVFKNSKTGKERIAQTGMWTLNAEDHSPGNEEAQIKELLEKLTDDLDVWSSIKRENKIDIFFGLFLGDWGENFILSPETMMNLAQRGIEIGLDIYGPDDE